MLHCVAGWGPACCYGHDAHPSVFFHNVNQNSPNLIERPQRYFLGRSARPPAEGGCLVVVPWQAGAAPSRLPWPWPSPPQST
jgi:hypothetical protein